MRNRIADGMRRPGWRIGALTLALTLPACKQKEAPTATTAPSTSPSSAPSPAAVDTSAGAEDGRVAACWMKISGDVTLEDTGYFVPGNGPDAGKVGALTDYWMSDGQLQVMLGVYGLDKKGGADKQKFDAAMSKDPRQSLLHINCMGEKIQLMVGPSHSSRYKDVPYQTATYKIRPVGPGEAAPGEFTATVNVGEDSFYRADGKLEIAKFDETGIQGALSFKASAIGHGKNIELNARFDIPCPTDFDRCKRSR